MSTNSPNSSSRPGSYLPERPQITRTENRDLPRIERIYNHLMWPKWFDLTEADTKHLERMRIAYNILIAAPTDVEARAMIRTAVLGTRLTISEVIELIYDTKELFGRINASNKDFDRQVVRAQLIELARRAREAGDLKQERLAWSDIIRLDGLALKEKESAGPIVPPLPDVVITNAIPAPSTRQDHSEPAIIESTPTDEEE